MYILGVLQSSSVCGPDWLAPGHPSSRLNRNEFGTTGGLLGVLMLAGFGSVLLSRKAPHQRIKLSSSRLEEMNSLLDTQTLKGVNTFL